MGYSQSYILILLIYDLDGKFISRYGNAKYRKNYSLMYVLYELIIVKSYRSSILLEEIALCDIGKCYRILVGNGNPNHFMCFADKRIAH